jgi:hypothetical protein
MVLIGSSFGECAAAVFLNRNRDADVPTAADFITINLDCSFPPAPDRGSITQSNQDEEDNEKLA